MRDFVYLNIISPYPIPQDYVSVCVLLLLSIINSVHLTRKALHCYSSIGHSKSNESRHWLMSDVGGFEAKQHARLPELSLVVMRPTSTKEW